jgi:four helix bundle protein
MSKVTSLRPEDWGQAAKKGTKGKAVNRIEKFEDIMAWQKARLLTKEVYQCTGVGAFARDYGLKDQIQRASVSTMANVAEGFERGGDKEFIQFLSNSKGSCGEVKSHLYVALDQAYITPASFDQMYGQASEAGRLLSGFMTYLRESNLRGRKYR